MLHFTWWFSLLKSSTDLTFFSAGWTPVINGRTPFFAAPFQGTRLPFFLPLVECNLLHSAEKFFIWTNVIFQNWWLSHPVPLHYSPFSIKSYTEILVLNHQKTWRTNLIFHLFRPHALCSWLNSTLFVNGNTFQLIDYIHSHGYVNAVADGHLLSNITNPFTH